MKYFVIYKPFFFEEDDELKNYQVLKNLVLLSIIHFFMISIKTLYGCLSWYNSYDRRYLEIYYQMSLTLYIYWVIIDILTIALKQEYL